MELQSNSIGTKKPNRGKQGRIHGNTVADGLAGAVIQSPIAILEIFVTDGRTDRPTRQGVESRVRD